MTIAHLSDLHFGRIAHDAIVDVLVDDVNAANVDLVVVSGDLTQRARPEEFNAATAMLARFTAPTLVVPGNHDVYPWWRPVARIRRPLGRYRQCVTDNTRPQFTENGVAVFGVNSAHGLTVKGGRINGPALQAMKDYFTAQTASTFKVLVLHHHLTKLKALGRHDIARRAQHALDVATSVGVDLILCGHLHISHIEPVEIIPDEQRVVIASAGTATSNRGRRTNRYTNFYNRIAIEAEGFTVKEYRYRPSEERFRLDSSTRFSHNLAVDA